MDILICLKEKDHEVWFIEESKRPLMGLPPAGLRM